MTTDLTRNPGRRHRPMALHLIALMSGLLLALGAGWGAASAAQSTTTPAAGTATPAVTPAPDARRLTISIGQLNDSGVTGTATLYEAGKDQTIVEIAVKNVSGNHPSHIHSGTCDKIAAEPAYDLQNIDKNGKSTTLITVSLDALLAKPFVIDAHLSPNELGTLIMCGEIKGKPVTPAGTPTATATATTPAATKPAATTPAATTPAATTPAATTPPTPTAVATTPAATTPPIATATATTAITPTGVGGETVVTPTTTPAATTPAVTPATLIPATVTSGKGIPAANGAVGGDGTGGSTASSTSLTVSAANTASTSSSSSSASASSSSGGGSASASLPGVDGSGATGTVTIFPANGGAGAVIQVSLQGDLVSADNLVHLHMGTCDNLDQNYTLDLNPVDGSGVSETAVDIPYQQLLTGGYAVNVHQSPDAYDTWLVCGELSNSVATTSTSTGTGGQTAALLPQRTGAGTSIPRPATTAEAIAWALGFFALLISASALLIRRRESAALHRPSSRWLRLGL